MRRPQGRDADVASFSFEAERGFLPTQDPLRRLPSAYLAWEEIAGDLPALLAARQARSVLDRLAPLDVGRLRAGPEWERAMLLLSYFGHAYVWGEGTPAPRLPAGVAIPWHQVASGLGRPPVLSYASYVLHNWRRLDPAGPIALGNIAVLQQFLGGLDEAWFILVHVEIEARAAPALASLVEAQDAVSRDAPEGVECHLGRLADALEAMHATLQRMPEGCDPHVYYRRVRPYIHGWKDNPALLQGVVYEGVDTYQGQPRHFRGETGAQSSIVPSFDAALGVAHRDDPLRPYLLEMREYMPAAHRAFIAGLEEGPAIREYVLRHRDREPILRHVYNRCLQGLARFRSQHLEYAAAYVQRQAGQAHNPNAVGTGGTPFTPYLKKHRDETLTHLV